MAKTHRQQGFELIVQLKSATGKYFKIIIP